MIFLFFVAELTFIRQRLAVIVLLQYAKICKDLLQIILRAHFQLEFISP